MNSSRIAFGILAIGLTSLGFAQTNNSGGDQRPHRGPGGPGPHHPPPVVAVIDANRDGVISADEIANAPAALKTLDQNGDGKLTSAELHPNRPADAPPPPADVLAHLPTDPVMLALDANSDGELSAQEIANASASLKALDANKDGQLTHDEIHPLPPKAD